MLGRQTPIVGDIASIDRAAAVAGDASGGCVTYSAYLIAAQGELGRSRGEAIEVCRDKLELTLQPGAQKLKDSADAARQGLKAYSEAVAAIHDRARAVRREVEEYLVRIGAEALRVSEIVREIRQPVAMKWDAPPSLAMPVPVLDPSRTLGMDSIDVSAARRAVAAAYEGEWRRAVTSWIAAVDGIRAARSTWSSLLDERTAAEQTLLSTLADTTLGQLISLGMAPGAPGPQHTIAHHLSGELRGETLVPGVMATEHPLLRGLFPLGDGSQVWSEPPDPEAAAEWWASLDEGAHETLIRDVPAVIGNLPGLPYGVRDRANRETLVFYARYPTGLTPEQLTVAARVQGMLRREASEREQYGAARPVIQVIALDLAGRVPMVAVGYGDSDSATHTTWMVPGMESDAHVAIGEWDTAARNLLRQQNNVSGFSEASSTIAWLGYDTPALADAFSDRGVLSSTSARLGARRLAAELDGNHSTRTVGSATGPAVNVVAHSYGTTTATIALAQIRNPVESITLIASAGLDTTLVPNYDVLNVIEIEPGQRAVYTTHASRDYLAASGAGLARRGQPNPDATGVLGLQRLSPVYERGLSFSSDGDEGQGLQPTDGHSLIGGRERRSVFGVASSNGHGYLDVDTQALKTVSHITTGQVGEGFASSLTRTRAACVDVQAPWTGVSRVRRVPCGK